MINFLTFLIFHLIPCQTEFDKMLEKYYTDKVTKIQPDELAALIETGADFTLIDIRYPNEYEVSSLKGALNIAGSSTGWDAPKDTRIIVYCTVGARSEEAAQELLNLGFTNVSNLYGGIIHWVNSGYPVYNFALLKNRVVTDRVHVYSAEWSKWLKTGTAVY